MRSPVLVVVLSLGALAACEPPGYGHHQVDAAVDGTHGDGTKPIDAAPDGPSVCDHAFRLDGHGAATSVWLTGDFIAWGGDLAHGAVAFTLDTNSGAWTGTRPFDPGTYQYKFIIDASQWITDPTNPMTISDGFGGFNSVFSCVP